MYISAIIRQRVLSNTGAEWSDLRQRLIDMWAGVEHRVIDNAIDSGTAIEPEDPGHFEYSLT